VSEVNCEHCRDGLVFTKNAKGETKMYACYCPQGEAHKRAMYAPSDKEKQRPFYLPVWKPKTEVDIRSRQYKDE
jgi:hypothetical protein